MSQGSPWNYQGMPQETNTGSIQFFNPGQFQNANQQEFDLTKQTVDSSQKSAINGQIPAQPIVNSDWNNWNTGWINQTQQSDQTNQVNNVGQGYYQDQGQVYQDQTGQVQGQDVSGQNQFAYQGQGQFYDPTQQFYTQGPYQGQNWQPQQQQQQYGYYGNQQNWNSLQNPEQQVDGSAAGEVNVASPAPYLPYQQPVSQDGQNYMNYAPQGQGHSSFLNQDYHNDVSQESDTLNSSHASDVSYDSTSCSQSITDAESSAASGFFNRSGASEPPLSTSGGGSGHFSQVHNRLVGQDHNFGANKEISGESLRTVHESGEGLNENCNPSVEAVSGKLQNTSVEEMSHLVPPMVSINNNDINQSANKHQTGNSEKSESLSPQSDDQHVLSDWEVVPPQTVGSENHSRHDSLDNNVHFFIGSSKNSSTGSTPLSFTHGQNNEVEAPQTTEQASGGTKVNDNTGNQGSTSTLLLPELTPQHASSPNSVLEGQMSSQNAVSNVAPPPPVATPPLGLPGGGSNPFRKDRTGSRSSSNHSQVSDEQKTQSVQQNILLFNPPDGVSSSNFDVRTGNRPHLDMTKNVEPPSPIMSSSEESVHVSHPVQASQKTKPQSPIMPRKESPFQPPHSRRRNLSQSSDTIEEQPKLEDKLQTHTESDPPHISKSDNDVKPVFNREDKTRQPINRNRRGSGGGEHLEMQDIKMSERERERHHDSRSRNSAEKLRAKPPPGSVRNVVSPRRIQNALQQAQEKRVKHNMSPATTLWADTDLKLVPNIILAPPTPASENTSGGSKGGKEVREVLSPVENLITSLSEQISKESTPEPSQEKVSNRSNDKSLSENRHVSRESRKDVDRDRHERHSSIDRELEISRQIEEKEQKGRKDRRNRSREGSLDRDRYEDDSYRDSRDSRYRDRGRDPRDYDPYYDPRYRDQYRGQYRDPYYGDERYERPRSRESYLEEERTPSRQSQQQDQTRSRQDYNRGQYRDRDRYAYDQDYYARHGYYDQYYYDKYYARDARYASAYYDEYYKGNQKYNESFNRLMDFSYNWSHGYPADYYDQHYHHGYDDNDRYSQRSHSRVNTPGSLSDVGEQDPYGYGSRSSSRQGQGYSEDPYYRGHYNGQYGQYDPYYQDRWNGYGYNQSVQEEIQPGRLTPEKYTVPHVRACLGPGGQLIKVLPNRPKDGQTAMIEVHDLQALCGDDAVKDEFNSFPGPLIRDDTHKNDVLLFCQKKAKACAENIDLMDRESAELIWRLLELLIKQNGTVVGTDIADLLLEGHEPTTVEYSMMGMKITQSLENLDEDLDETTEVTVSDRSVVNRGRSREETTDRFRHLLLYGRKKDALEWAMKNNLWGHALFLASKMDNRAHANVMTRFANSAMKMNDPLQTLYQLMSGRQPAAVTSIVDEKWGDWRPHLAMILSNHTQRTELDRKSITTLGDTLGSKGLLHASHLCYLMAQVNFGSYNKKTSKLVLVGANHSLPLQEFATNEAIHCTEIYEYAMSLGNAGFYLPNFQYFKFLYASRLAENGFAQEALQYCEIMSRYIQANPALFQPILVKLVYELANRLKHFDPQRLQMGDDAEDPYWLQHLLRISAGFEDGSIQPVSGSVTPMFNYGTRASSESGEVANYTQSGDIYGVQPPQLYSQDTTYQAGVQESGHHDYNNYANGQHSIYSSQQVQQQQQEQTPQVLNQETHQQQQQHVAQEQHQQQPYQHQQQQHQQQHGSDQQQTGYNYSYTQHQPQEASSYDQNQGYGYGQTYTQPQEGYAGTSHTVNQDQVSHSTTQHPQLHEYQHQNQYNNTDTTQQITGNLQHRNSITSTTSGSVAGDETENVDGGIQQNHSEMTTSSFDYFGAATTGKIVAPRLRKRTESECSQRSTGSQPVKRQFSDEKPVDKTAASKKQDKSQPQGQNKGWFGGLFNRFKGSNNNEMKLPDDKNPAIVWDPVKKRWMNKDGTEEDSAPTAPPPKDMEIHGSTANNARSNSLTTPSLGASMGPPAAGNKYSKGKGRGARTQYVDVMNPKPVSNSTVPTSLFNVMPSVASAPAIFNPSGCGHGNSSEGGISETADTSQSQTPAETQTQPAGMTAPPGGDTSQTGDGAAMTQEGSASLPMMFNPAQFTPKQNAASKGGLQKYGQRRIYPK